MSKKDRIKKKNKEPVVIHGIPCDSVGEAHLVYYFQELKENGFILDYKRGDSYLLSESLINNYVEQLKTRSKPKTQTVMFGHSYNLDFEVTWTDEGCKYFCSNFGGKITNPFVCNGLKISYIESKPTFDFANMQRLATINIKWLHQRYGIYCQIIKNDELFAKTFVPKAILKTSKGKDRSFKYKTRSLEEYLKMKEK